MTPIWIPAVGAVLAALVGVLAGGLVTGRAQRHHWARDRQAEACAGILRESSNVLLTLQQLSRSQRRRTSHLRRWRRRFRPAPAPAIDWRPWNETLAIVSLIADHDIVAAAQEIDAKIWRTHLIVSKGHHSDERWFALRDEIDSQRQAFVNVARQRLGASGPPLRHLTGRPTPDDPIWTIGPEELDHH
ncbi:hypothetical protein [Nonomuraea insulae]|uniref:Secreted protein n=1 Tax=Nonomuraea insulae TaxID=1616787 RepID=A0ABW1CDB3_9ACTN